MSKPKQPSIEDTLEFLTYQSSNGKRISLYLTDEEIQAIKQAFIEHGWVKA